MKQRKEKLDLINKSKSWVSQKSEKKKHLKKGEEKKAKMQHRK